MFARMQSDLILQQWPVTSQATLLLEQHTAGVTTACFCLQVLRLEACILNGGK